MDLILDILIFLIVVSYYVVKQVLLAKILVNMNYEWYTACIPFYCEYTITKAVFGTGLFYLLELLPFVFIFERYYVMYSLMRSHGLKPVCSFLCAYLLPVVGLVLILKKNLDFQGQRTYFVLDLIQKHKKVRV